jgi:hypothetical protein
MLPTLKGYNKLTEQDKFVQLLLSAMVLNRKRRTGGTMFLVGSGFRYYTGTDLRGSADTVARRTPLNLRYQGKKLLIKSYLAITESEKRKLLKEAIDFRLSKK